MITLPEELSSATKPRPACMLPAMPFEIHFRGGQKLRPSLENGSTGPVFLLDAKTKEEFIAGPLEDWEVLSRTLIDRFLAVSNPEEALTFLASTGHFLWDAWSLDDPHHRSSLSWLDFQEWQELIRTIDESGFQAVTVPGTGPGELVTTDRCPAGYLNAECKRLALTAPQSTIDILNGYLPNFELVSLLDTSNPEGPSLRSLVIETMTAVDTMLARMMVEDLIRS